MRTMHRRISLCLCATIVAALTACPSVPTRPQTDRRDLDEGKTAFMKGDYLNAERALQKILSSTPSSPQAPEAHYWLGLCCLTMSKPREALHHLEVAQVVAHQTWLYSIGVAAMRSGEMKRGRGYLMELVRTYPRSEEGKKAAEKLALTESGYVIQLGYFQNSRNAETEAARASKAGIPASVKRVTTDTGAMYAVVAGLFSSWQEAFGEAERIKQKGFSAVPIP